MVSEEVTEGGALITVRACKFDGREHRRWDARLVQRSGSLLVLDGTFEAEVRHDLLGTIASGTRSIEYYWLDRWYNVFRFVEVDGRLRNFYCNVGAPPAYDGRVLSFVDLDMDVLVAPDLSYRILDEDEFALNVARYGYPAAVQEQAHNALAELKRMIEMRQFPFKGE